MRNIKIISAGAGSGKTYRLTQEMVDMLSDKGADGQPKVRASGIIATTFTKKAAAELQERVRVKLLSSGMTDEANDLANAMIGTVHGLGVNLLKRFAFEAGVSPEVQILADEDQQTMFNQSLSQVLKMDVIQKMTELSNRLGMNKKGEYDWRKDVKQLTEVARANDFSIEVLEKSKKLSFESFKKFLPKVSGGDSAAWHAELKVKLEETIAALEANEDTTKTTNNAVTDMKSSLNELKVRGELFWHQWAKISKLKVGAKSRDDFEPMFEFARIHDECIDFQNDIKSLIDQLFDLTIAGIEEYQRYKNQRGLIDYTDMEALVKKLLDNPSVNEVLSEELDLLMVDEFQDTSPLQLEIFLKLSKLAKASVWVGDPKQSIYGFRGAEPKLMEAIVAASGGIKPENIQEFSWRSRQDVVNATNAIFVKSFDNLKEEQVRLIPKRTTAEEPKEMQNSFALNHWHFKKSPELKRMPGKPWMENCIATTLKNQLDAGIPIVPKGETEVRMARPGDVAILCRSNGECQTVAEALHRAGLKAAISRAALLHTAEATLVLACLKFILNKRDTLSLAEVLKLADNWSTEKIIEHRLDYLEDFEADPSLKHKWAADTPIIEHLSRLRKQVIELSSSEILNLLLDELDLRRTIVQWGKTEQRLANVDRLCKLSLQYEEGCNRLHTAASLGGFLLWLYDLEGKGLDEQGSGEGPHAVNVLTYHKSKGLEYPVTICHSLENRLWDSIWGIEIVPESEEVDLDNLLGNRWLRYWINPYGDQIKATGIQDRLLESEVQKQKTAHAKQEEARLMYVGITRARDYLVFPSREGKKTSWLNRVWNGVDDQPTLDPTTNDSPWEWNEEILTIVNQMDYFDAAFQETEIPLEKIEFIKPPSGHNFSKGYEIQLANEKIEVAPKLKVSKRNTFSPPLEVDLEANRGVVLKMVNSILAADNQSYSLDIRREMAEGLLDRFELEEYLPTEKLMRHSDSYLEFIKKHYADAKSYRKYPFKTTHDNRVFETTIDHLLVLENRVVVIHNSSYAGLAKGAEKKLNDMKDWMFLVSSGVSSLFPGKEVELVVCYPVLGLFYGVEVPVVRAT